MPIQPTCVEAMTCQPDFSNPLQWLEVYGRSLGLPVEFGLMFMLLTVIGAIYIRTHNITLTTIALSLVVAYAATSAFMQQMNTVVVLIVIAVSAVIILLIYKLKGEIIQ